MPISQKMFVMETPGDTINSLKHYQSKPAAKIEKKLEDKQINLLSEVFRVNNQRIGTINAIQYFQTKDNFIRTQMS